MGLYGCGLVRDCGGSFLGRGFGSGWSGSGCGRGGCATAIAAAIVAVTALALRPLGTLLLRGAFLGMADPALDADLAVNGHRLGEAVINFLAKGLKRNLALA